jgi:CoA:oxalate CoA-transferase
MTAAPGHPLAGLVVLDMATMVAGPLAATLLADFGAEVIKIEHLGGDESRGFGETKGEFSGVFVGVNRNKRAAAIDLRSQEGANVLRRLAERADVVIDNARPSSRARYGIDGSSLRAINRRLITASVSAFGVAGPYAGRPGLDPVAQALSGMMATTGTEESGPLKAGPPIADSATAYLTAFAILVAVQARDRTGRGQSIDASLLETLVHLQTPWIGQYFLTGFVQPLNGNGSVFYAPYEAFQARDGGMVHVVAYNDRFFAKLADAIDRADLLTDPRFETGEARLANRLILHSEIQSWFSHRGRDEAVQRLSDHDIICAPVLDYRETFQHPQVLANDMAPVLEHDVLGQLRVPGIPVKLRATPGRLDRPPPHVGEHTAAVLADLGFTTSEIEKLQSAGVTA